jgi:ABC-2 type transport system ATP-binding protein
VREVHRTFAGYYRRPRDVDEVIELVGLDEKRGTRVKHLSGGQKRRLDLGVALVGDPDLVFLDEPTTGFDPAARRAAWEMIRSLRSLGKTVLLTTHYLDEPTTGFDPAARRAAWEMIRSLRSLGKTVLLTTHYLDEAEQLADRVAVMREGRIVRVGTPRELTSAEIDVEIRYRRDGEEILLRTSEPTRVLHELTSEAVGRGEELERLEVRRPTLEEVYLALVENAEEPE